jgi:uncharacterized membrane protein
VSTEVPNPFTMNDWNIADFLKAIFIIQVVLLSVIALDSTALKIPLLRTFFALIYLMFVPGITLLRVFRLHRLGSVETALYAVGLSVATVMFTGLVLNTVGPAIGIMNPLSLIPLIFSLSALVLILGALSYVRDKSFSDTAMIGAKDVPPSVLFFLLLPFLSIYGTFAMNAYQNNILLMILLLVIASAIIISVYKKKDLTNIYPLIVFSISLALLFSLSLISPYTSGFDAQFEHYSATLVVQQSHWNSSLADLYNSVLSLVMLAPILSIICNLDLTWVFKIVYPLMYSLVPVGLYWLYKKQMDSTVAFLSVMFFVSTVSFYGLMPSEARQETAELFLVLILLLIVDFRIQKTTRSILLITFSFAMIVSHYSLTYIFMLSLVPVLIILSATKLINQRQKGSFFPKLRLAAKTPKPNLPRANTDTAFTAAFMILFIITTLAWFTFVSGASSVASLLDTFRLIAASGISELFSPASAQGAAILLATPVSTLHTVDKYLYLIGEFFVVVGFAATLLKYNSSNLRLRPYRELSAFNVPLLALLVAAIAIPYVAQSLQTARVLHISLIFLAPLFVIGAVALFEAAGKVVPPRSITYQGVLSCIAVFLAIFLLFDSGFIYQVTNDHPYSNALNSALDGAFFNKMEIVGAQWLVQHNQTEKKIIFADSFRSLLLGSLNGGNKVINFPSNLTYLAHLIPASGGYQYLGTLNVQQNQLYVGSGGAATPEYAYVNATPATSKQSLIYANGGCEIYFS